MKRILALLGVTLGTLNGAGAAPAPELLEKGRTLYQVNCARCHGADGADTSSYPNVKSLVDVTARLSGPEILQRSTAFAGVNLAGEAGTALLAHLTTFQSESYPNAALLVDTKWVAEHGRDPDVRIVDMRPAAAYGEGHIPGAVQVEERPLRTAEDRETYLPKPEVFAGLMQAAGISNGTHVVIYDDQGGRLAARLWYVLNAFGHGKVSLVNGGWNRWKSEGRPVTQEVPNLQLGRFTPKVTPTLTCPSTEVLARKPGTVVLDTRSEREYRGGRLPNAVNVDWQENVTGPDRVFKPAAELKQLYAAKGVTPDKEIVTHCASGGRAAQSLFTLKLLGYPRVRVYYGSYSDYTTRPNAPVEK